jgi:hypothetical protein
MFPFLLSDVLCISKYFLDNGKHQPRDFEDFYVLSFPEYSVYVYVCFLLAPEQLNGFYLYSVFKIFSCPLNFNFVAPKAL